MPPRVDPAKNHHPEDPAVAGHTTVPDTKNSKRIFGQHRRSVKKDIPEPTAEEHAKKRCIKDEIADLVFPQRAVSFSSQPFHQVKRGDESGDVSEAIPSDAELFIERNEERTEMVNVEGEQHGWRAGFGFRAGDERNSVVQ